MSATFLDCITYYVMQLVRDLDLSEYEEEIDAFFASEIADSVRKYQLESSDDVAPSAEGQSDHIECFAQNVLLWTTGRSREEILQRLKYQPKTKQFMFVTGELPIDARVRLIRAKRSPSASRGLQGNSSRQRQQCMLLPSLRCVNPTLTTISYTLHVLGACVLVLSLGGVHIQR